MRAEFWSPVNCLMSSTDAQKISLDPLYIFMYYFPWLSLYAPSGQVLLLAGAPCGSLKVTLPLFNP